MCTFKQAVGGSVSARDTKLNVFKELSQSGQPELIIVLNCVKCWIIDQNTKSAKEFDLVLDVEITR